MISVGPGVTITQPRCKRLGFSASLVTVVLRFYNTRRKLLLNHNKGIGVLTSPKKRSESRVHEGTENPSMPALAGIIRKAIEVNRK